MKTEEIMNWCYKNNTVKIGNINLCTTDGGWVNVLELKKFLESSESNEITKENLK